MTVQPIYSVGPYENATIGTELLQHVAFDADRSFHPLNSSITFHIANNVPFIIDTQTGMIKTSAVFDVQTFSRFVISVEVGETLSNETSMRLSSLTPVIVKLSTSLSPNLCVTLTTATRSSASTQACPCVT